MNKVWLSVLTLSLSACAVSPLGRNQLILAPDAQLNAVGQQSFQQQKQSTPLSRDGKANAMVACVVRQLLGSESAQWEVAVFEDATPNAFALPGGKIGVNHGMLKVARNQHQLATVLAHEITHVRAKHANERMSQQWATQQGLDWIGAATQPTSENGRLLLGLLGVGAQYGVLMPYSRVQEEEADLAGLDLMASAGFNPAEAIQLWRNMEQAGGAQPAEFLSTHPSHANRIQALQGRLPHAQALQQQAVAANRHPNCD